MVKLLAYAIKKVIALLLIIILLIYIDTYEICKLFLAKFYYIIFFFEHVSVVL